MHSLTRNSVSGLALVLATSVSYLSIWNNAGAVTVPYGANPQVIRKTAEPPLPPRSSGSTVEAPASTAGVSDSIPAFRLTNVRIVGSTVYKPEEFRDAYSGLIGREVSVADLNALVNTITTRYRKDGYILSRAVITPQNISGGDVTVQVIEGYVSNISYVGLPESRKSLVEGMAGKITNNKPLNIKSLERYLLLIDDLPGVKARGFLRPSASIPWASELVITLDHKKHDASLQADNRGSRYLGRYQLTGVAALNNGMGLYDRLTVRGITTGESEELRYIDILNEQQLGAEGTKLLIRGSYAHAQPGGPIRDLNIDGKIGELDVTVNHPFIRTRSENLNGFVGLDYFQSDYDITTLQLYTDRVRTAYVGFEYDKADSLRGVNQAVAQVRQGVDVFGAAKGSPIRSRGNGDEAFTLVKGEVNRVQALPGKLSLFGGVSGQYSFDPLFVSEQFAVGGPFYGRAYDAAEISGDSGVAGKIELRFSNEINTPVIKDYQVYGYYDIGRVWLKKMPAGVDDSSSLASAGVGIRSNLAYDLTGNVEVNWPLTKNIAAERGRGDEPRVFFSLNKRF